MNESLRDPELLYVAPVEAPPPRRPPPQTVGWRGWLRQNLFSTPLNSVITIITAIIVGWFLISVLNWALRDAEWTVITTNLRLLMAGQYEPSELWRPQLLALIALFLCGVSVVLAAGAGRSVLITLAIAVIALLVIPLGAAQLPPPPIRVIVTATNELGPLLFTGEAGQVVTVAVEPIDDNSYVDNPNRYAGYLENSGGLQNARTTWNEIKAQVAAGTLDLSSYDITFTASLVDADGNELALATSTPEERAVSFSATLPDVGWYGLVISRPDGMGTLGSAFVRIDGVETYTTDTAASDARFARYGTPPTLECPTAADCRRFVAARNVRFEGSRSLGQYLSTQLAPFINAIVVPVIAAIGAVVLGGVIGALARRSPLARRWMTRLLIVAWLVTLIGSWFLLRGFDGSATLPGVPTSLWGGLLLTMVLTVVAIIASFPIGVVLALGRTSNLPILSAVCTIFIEVIRGVPFITVLFFAKLIVPFFISASADVDQAIRMMIGLSIFTAAYLAEVVRGGLQIVPNGQVEAAKALGLNAYQQTTEIVLPQALRAVIPAIMNQFVALFKDTSLVAVVGLFELLGIIDFIVNGQQQFRGLNREAYLFVGIIYFVISYAMSSASKWVERTGVGAARR
jgi:general L-amino acid transport system permease protein